MTKLFKLMKKWFKPNKKEKSFEDTFNTFGSAEELVNKSVMGLPSNENRW